MKHFPWEWESRKPILVYPDDEAPGAGDVLEIGPGRGDLFLSMAQTHPNQKIVAIEIGKKRYYKMIPRIEKLGLTNVQIICGDARLALPKWFEGPTFEKVYVLFPDPWPKARHELKRLLHTEFLTLLASVIKPGGDLFMATDVDWYAEWAMANADSMPSLENLGKPWVTAEELYGYAPTFFEQKWRAEGRQIYYMRYRRTDVAVER